MFCMVFLENRIEMGGRQPSHLISILDKLHGYVEEEERIILVKSEFLIWVLVQKKSSFED